MRRAFDSIDSLSRLSIRCVRLSGGRVLEVRGDGYYTLYRHAYDTTSPYAGQWILASPEFRAEIARAEASA